MAATQPPSALSYSIASGLLGLVAGYFIGSGSSIGIFDTGTGKTKSKSKSKSKSDPSKSWPNSYDVKVHVDSSDEELAHLRTGGDADDESSADEESEDEDMGEDGDGKELKDFGGSGEEVKLVLGVRTDLGMGKGKIAAQCSHATLACYKYLVQHSSSSSLLKRWEWNGQPKIAVQVKDEEQLLTLQAQAMSLGLCARVIRDAGRTQIAAGSATVLGVLGPKSVVDQVTGQLKLL